MTATPNTLSTSEYWMSPDALTIDLNALDNPQYLQVSLLAGSVITAYRQDVIEYDASLNYRKWTLQAYNNFFDRTDRAYVYAQLEKEGNTALIIYSYDILELSETVTSDTEGSREVYNVYLGTISSSVNSNGESIPRIWETTFETGSLNTDKNLNEGPLGEWAKMFRLNKVTDMIEVLKDITSAVIHKLYIGARKIMVTDVQTSSESDMTLPASDTVIPTTKFLKDSTEKKFHRKDQTDINNFLQKFLGGIILPFIQSEEFTSGPLGSGFTLKTNADKTTYLEVDKMLIRMKAVFQVLEILKTELGGASFLFNASGARATITKVEKLEQEVYFIDDEKGYFSNGDEAYFPDVYRCFFSTDDGDTAIENLFKVGDFVRSQTFNIKAGVHENVQNHYWWRKVVGTGDDYIDLSSVDFASDSDIPQEGDVIVQLGNDRDTDRQSAILLSAYGDNAPYFTMYQGIDSYSLSGKEIFTVYYDSVEKECVLRIGREGEKGYLRYSSSKGLIVEGSIEVLGGSGVSNFDDALEFSEQINDRMSQYLGYDGWESMVTEALAGRTIIKGGVINTSLINVDSLFAGEIYAGNATISEGTFKKINVEEATISNSTLTEVNVTGTINANAGYIGGFKIENSRLSYNYSDNNKTSPSIIINVDTNESFRINENPTSNGPFMQIRSQKRSAIDIFTGGGHEDDPSAIHVTCNAKGYGKAIESYGNVQMTARDSENIKISGLALNVRTTSSSETLTSGDDVIISTSDRNITLNLPYNLGKKDKIIWIRKSGLGNITVSGNGLSIKGNNEFGNGGWHDSVEIANGQLWMFFCTGGVWFANCLT